MCATPSTPSTNPVGICSLLFNKIHQRPRDIAVNPETIDSGALKSHREVSTILATEQMTAPKSRLVTGAYPKKDLVCILVVTSSDLSLMLMG